MPHILYGTTPTAFDKDQSSFSVTRDLTVITLQSNLSQGGYGSHIRPQGGYGSHTRHADASCGVEEPHCFWKL